MDWFPIVFIAFKVIVLGTGMFLAIKWHHDQGNKKKNNAGRVGGHPPNAPLTPPVGPTASPARGVVANSVR